MGHPKVRCVFCGAKNTDRNATRCRICGGVLPGALERKAAEATAGDSFKAMVEGEVETWQDYMEGRYESNGLSRRPAELPPVHTKTAVPGQAMTDAPDPQPSANREPPPEEPAPRAGRLRRLFSL